MAVVVKPNGEFTVIYSGPYGGFHSMLPENLLPDNFSPAFNDFILRNGELISRPQFISTGLSPAPAAKINTTGSLNGVLWATSGNSLYSYNFGTGLWTSVGSGFTLVNNWRIFDNVTATGSASTLFLNSLGHLSTWDGTTFTLDTATVAAVNIGSVFIDELDNHLILANTSEGAFNFNSRIRWSATSKPNVFDPTVNVNAGFNDFLDVPDTITGMLMLGRVGYILRSDGITEMAPTGVGTAPFEFNHLWGSQNGIGNVKYYGWAQYGLTGVIIARDNIYSIQSYNVQPIGGGARDAIMSDLANVASGSGILPTSFAVIMPYVQSSVIVDTFAPAGGGVIPTFVYLCYYLFINQGNNCKVWVYSFDENNWMPFNLPGINVTGKPSLCIDAFQNPTMLVPAKAMPSGNSALYRFDPTTFNDALQGSSYSYKIEDVIPNMVCTVRRVILTYRDLGQVTLNVNVAGTNDNGATVSVNQARQIGSVSAGSKLKTAFFEPVDTNGNSFTGFRPQLTVSRALNGGPIDIVMATMIGKVDMENL